MAEKYTVHDYTVEQILNFIKSNEIAIPEIQRPFVWKGWQVRDLVDSLYQGYPTGYIIISKSPDLKLKDGSLSIGKKIMVDGKQRVTAKITALSRLEVFNADFETKDFKESYHSDLSPLVFYQIFPRFFLISLRIFLSFNLRSLLARVGFVLIRFLGITRA